MTREPFDDDPADPRRRGESAQPHADDDWDASAMAYRDAEKRTPRGPEIKRAVVYAVAVLAVTIAVFATTQLLAPGSNWPVFGPPVVAILGGFGCLFQTYRAWKRFGWWQPWLATSWALLAVSLLVAGFTAPLLQL